MSKPDYPAWLREAAKKGGKTSKRRMTSREARRIALLGWEKRRANKEEK